jgi:hypothetical protein
MIENKESSRKELTRILTQKYIHEQPIELPGCGWFSIIYTAHKKFTMLDYNYKITSIREKWGTLKFHYLPSTKYYAADMAMRRYARTAEYDSAKTCEFCGNAGYQLLVNGFIKTICHSCVNIQQHTG